MREPRITAAYRTLAQQRETSLMDAGATKRRRRDTGGKEYFLSLSSPLSERRDSSSLVDLSPRSIPPLHPFFFSVRLSLSNHTRKKNKT